MKKSRLYTNYAVCNFVRSFTTSDIINELIKTQEFKDKERKFQIKVNNEKSIEMVGKVNVCKMLDILMLELLKNYDSKKKEIVSNEVSFSIEQYLTLRNMKISDKTIDKHRIEIKKILDSLVSISLSLEGENKKDYVNFNFVEGYVLKNSRITLRFTSYFLEYLNAIKLKYIESNLDFLKANDLHTPYSYHFGKTIDNHYTMNKRKSNSNIIRIKTLCDKCHNFDTYFNTLNNENILGTHFKRKILDRFEKNLNSLINLSWEYSDLKPKNFQDFIDSKIIFKFIK